MNKELETDKECPDCGGEGKGTVDYHNPADFHGHGQYESECGTCEGTGRVEIDEEEAENRAGIRALWASAQKNMTPPTQERVKNRVVRENWSLDKAIKNEGLIFVRRNIDIAPAKEMFEAGDLKVEKPAPPAQKAENLTEKEAEVFGIEAPKEEKSEEIVDMDADCGVADPKVLCRQPFCKSCKGKDRFVPRPKSNQE